MARTKYSSRQSLQLLLALILRDGCYGWQLAKQLNLNEKTVYGILKRLREDGYVREFWDVPGVEKPKLAAPPSYLKDEEGWEKPVSAKGAPQRRYSLTSEGAKFVLELQKKFGKGKHAHKKA